MRLCQTSGGSAGTTRFAYDALALIGEYNSSNALLRRYVHGPGVDEPLVWYEGSGTTDRRFLHADERGSVVAVTNSSGTTLNVSGYYEYGIPSSGNAGRFQYTGQTWLPELGMYYYKARIYSPTLGRFLQADPIGFVGGMNLYWYVGGDPVDFVDPLGLESKCIDASADITLCGQRGASPGGFAGGGSVAGNSGGSTVDRPDGPQDAPADIIVTGERPPPPPPPPPPSSAGGQVSGGPSVAHNSDEDDDEAWQEFLRDRAQRATLKTAVSREACYRSASERLSARMSGRPAPDLVTWGKASLWAGIRVGLYWIISEGSRLILVRNLIPVP